MAQSGVGAPAEKLGGAPSQTFTRHSQDSAFCPLLPGQDAGRGSGWAATGTMQGWNRRARESPGQMSKPDRTQLSQDLGGGTLAIDSLPDNRTRVVVSAGGTWSVGVGGGSAGGDGVPHVRLSDVHATFPLGLVLEVRVERGIWRGWKQDPA